MEMSSTESSLKGYLLQTLVMIGVSISVVLGLVAIASVANIATYIVYELTISPTTVVQTRGAINAAQYVSMFIGGVIWLVLLFGGFGYHMQYAGTPRSNRILLYTILTELVLIAVNLALPVHMVF